MWRDLIELLLPMAPTCGLCGRKATGTGFCTSCLQGLVKVSAPFCQRCGKEVKEVRCNKCHAFDNSFAKARAVGYYTGFLQQAIYQYKFLGKRTLAQPLSKLMVWEIYNHPFYSASQLVVPIPLHPNKMKQRGFNQAQLLAAQIAAELELPEAAVLQRIKDTAIQGQLTGAERWKNVMGAFQVADHQHSLIKDKTILLIDDVLTSGSTVHQGAITLLEAGASKVLVFTLAVGRGK